jgi:muramoyltetrapeptide carboxypeptidase
MGKLRTAMRTGHTKIGVVAPATRIEPGVAEKVAALAQSLYPERTPEIRFHPQCFLSAGHFAGDDETRASAFLEMANDESLDAVWFARGGYGSCRMAVRAIAGLTDAARKKTYLGYSDAGALLAGLYSRGLGGLAHGPMPSDLAREGGSDAVERALAFLVEGDPASLEATVSPSTRTAAFNITILSNILGTSLEPDLSGHILMLEEVSEYMYAIDRTLFHITSTPSIRRVSGIKLGRCGAIPSNDPDFGQTEEDVAKHWCEVSGIPYLGRADIGHDIGNKIVPFGRYSRSG